MISGWEIPRIANIQAHESRRLVRLPIPGLSGDLHQDLGRSALVVDISGSLYGDEARDEFLINNIRPAFLAGDPVDFVADIVTEAELEQVLIEALHIEESADTPNQFHYRIRLREYTEPPEPPGSDLGLEAPDLGLDIDLGLDLLDLPGLLVPLPDIGDLLQPIEPAADSLRDALSGAADAFSGLESLFDNPPAGDT
ncbi:hypothetical protein [Teredinibacter haidensis]|uniref:hypothetical protein n=1 Tax=Teredinibacter haidensis TaxID=2731755 RepID=UPI001587FDC3|nr:hypothetical protein [Teredinibacter haidensis]